MSDERKWTSGPWRAQQLLPDGFVITKEGWEIATDGYDVCANILRGAPIRKEADARLTPPVPATVIR